MLDGTINTWLEITIRRHTAADWGAMYPEAIVWWTAHAIETTPGTGAGSDSAEVTGALLSQRDGDLSRTYAAPIGPASTGSSTFGSTHYGQMYLDLLRSRAVQVPFYVMPA